jgi:hypothetical protein
MDLQRLWRRSAELRLLGKDNKAMRKKILSIIIMSIVTITLVMMTIFTSFANDSDLPVKGTSGNIFTSQASVTDQEYSNEFFWAGQTLYFERNNVTGEAFGAGQTIQINDSNFVGGLKLAAQDISVSGSKINQTLMAACQSLTVTNATDAHAIYFAGQNFSFEGTSTEVQAYGEKVVINGTVNGDVNIQASTVKIGDNAVINGNLKVESSKKPEISSSATITGTKSIHIDKKETAKENTFADKLLAKATFRFYMAAVTVLLAAILCLIMGKNLDSAKEMVEKSAPKQLLTGLVALAVSPIAIIVLCITIIGIPIAILLGMVIAVISMTATAFTGAALGRLVFKKWNVWPASILGAFVVSIVKIIPIFGGLVSLAAFIFMLGWIIQYNWQKFEHGKSKKDDVAPEVIS